MAFSVTTLAEYVEQNRLPLITKMVIPSSILNEIDVQTNIKHKAALDYLDVGVTIQAKTDCSFTPIGDDTFTQREITVNPLKVNKQWCPDTLAKKWNNYEVVTAANAQALPFERVLIDEIIAKENDLIVKNIFQGNTGTASTYMAFDGVSTIVSASASGAHLVTASASVYTTVTNIYLAMNDIVKESNPTIYLSPSNYSIFIQELIALNRYIISNEGNGSINLWGTNCRVKSESGLAGSKYIIGTYPKNIVYGTDLVSDQEQFRLFLSEDTNIKFISEWKSGVQIKFMDDMYYSVLA